ncbi:GNAT family N-acetyltransferase [Clostridium intestinale]|uniref:GNAT family N-acetyltransferase n=1 Tax=Clostridium intestinale TaxID=36845 RepID=UPI0028EF4393|nr:GNAT family N-acetyltransferase [Clostridium intestinale]
MIIKIIETKRLYLRELVPEDKNELSKVLSDFESMKYYPKVFGEEKVEKWIQWNIENYSKYNHGLWAVILKEGEVFLGDCGITMQRIEDEVVPEIGFHIIKDYCNKGYATEAALACKEYAFEILNYSRVFSITSERNIPSQKVAEKIGMKFYKYFDSNGEKHVSKLALKE